jgi:MFS family permease
VVLLGGRFFLFGIVSAGCALSTALVALVAWRALQGIGAAMIQAAAAAAITTIVRGMPIPIALGIFGTSLGLGPVLGPTIGGILLSTVGGLGFFGLTCPSVQPVRTAHCFSARMREEIGRLSSRRYATCH